MISAIIRTAKQALNRQGVRRPEYLDWRIVAHTDKTVTFSVRLEDKAAGGRPGYDVWIRRNLENGDTELV